MRGFRNSLPALGGVVTIVSHGFWPWLCHEALAVPGKGLFPLGLSKGTARVRWDTVDGPPSKGNKSGCGNIHTGGSWEMMPRSPQGKAQYPQLRPHRFFRH